MASVDVGKAIDFVRASGDPILSALALLAIGETTTRQALEVLSAYQRPDGGWTKTDKDFQGDLSAISTTWVALQWLGWIEDRDSDVLERTIAHVRDVQRDDGAWDEPDEILAYDPPTWMMPGRHENQLWLTAAICCKLKEMGREGDVDLERALGFVRAGWDGQRFPVFVHTHWMAMPLLAMHGAGDEEIVEGCRRFLSQAIADDRVDPGDYCAVAYASLLTGEPAEGLCRVSLQRVQENQMRDGGWRTNYDPKHRVGFTVDALFLLRRAGLLGDR